MSLIRIAVDRVESMAIINSEMRAFAFNGDKRPGLAMNLPTLGATVEFVSVDDEGNEVINAPTLIRSVRAVLCWADTPSLREGHCIILLDAPGTSDPNYAEAAQRAQEQRMRADLDQSIGMAGTMEQLMQQQIETLRDTPSQRERIAAGAMVALVKMYGKGDAEAMGAHVAQQSVCWADALIAELNKRSAE